MKKYLILAGIAATFFACGDNGSSASDNSNEFKASGTIKVDEKNHTAVTVVNNTETLCVYENLEYSWKTVNWGEDRDSVKYEFVGDTLVIYKGYGSFDQEFSQYGDMFVGGSAGSLNGTWHSTLCEYDSERKKSSCRSLCSDVKNIESDWMKAFEELLMIGCVEDDEVKKVTLKISGSDFTTSIEYPQSLRKNVFDDYMNSEFMSEFYYNLKKGYTSVPSVSYLRYEDSTDVEDYIEDSVVTIISQTKNSVSFKFKEQTLSVKVGEYERGDDKETVSMDISYNGKTCNLTNEAGVVTKSICKAEYGEYFDKSTDKDVDGNVVTYVLDYEKSNGREFSDCVEDVLDSVYAAARKLEKETEGDEDEVEDECESLYRDYIDCAYQGYSNCSKYLEQYTLCSSSTIESDVVALSKKATATDSKEAFLKRQKKLVRWAEKFAE